MFDDTTIAQAENIDRRLTDGLLVGPLAGVPVAIKDLIYTRSLRTTFGSRLYSDFVPERDDIAIERLRQAGRLFSIRVLFLAIRPTRHLRCGLRMCDRLHGELNIPC